MKSRIVRLLVVLVSFALMATATVVTSTAADAAPHYKRMSTTETTFSRAVLAELNKERASHGLKRLKISSRLTRGASAHNRSMAKVNTISHQLAGERDFVARDKAAGWKFRCASGENVGVNGDMSRAGAVQLQTLMFNEVAPNNGHRLNILNTRYSHVGISILLDHTNDRLWVTLDFGQRRC